MATPEVKYVPTLIRWKENGKIQERYMKIEEGFNFKFEQSGKKYEAKAYNSPGKMPVLNLEKEDAYNILGLSHAHEDGYKNKKGQQIYVLNNKDIEAAKQADRSNMVDNLTRQHTSWAGSGARVVNVDVTTSGGLSIIHKGTNSQGRSVEYGISIFNNKKHK